ncbi:MAG TPA: Gfo/Idh/MocA family oxidoreductase [Chitinophagaceae bacterium]|nr:Gfo/Idh/MocA family oxidoreductase [Chitinophagaceae bacterium]
MPNNLTRRDWLRIMGIAAGASTIPVSSWAHNELGEPIHLPDNLQLKNPGKAITAITCGAGNRGNVYGNFAVTYPDQLDIIGVAEPIAFRNERYAKKHNIEAGNRFNTWEEIFKRPKFADAVIITTPDNLHYGPCMAALEKGYDVLLEKPISPSEKECREILALAKKKGRIVAVCHVLRYAPYFMKLKEMMHNGSIGQIISVQHLEPIHHIHMSHSYVRGNWHNSKETTPIILAKSCHDLDIIKWMLDKHCTHMSAHGDVKWFRKENAPEGSTARCTDGCKVEGECPYSAKKIYFDKRQWLHHFDLPEDKSKHGDVIMDYLKNSNYGKCVYRSNNDQPDHYTTNMLFEDNITVSFSMEAFTSYDGRRTRVMGSLGDIVGDMSSFKHTDFRTGKVTEWKQETDGHGGGDWRLVADWIQAVSQQNPALLSSTIDASIESHVMGFAAEKSRKEKVTVPIKM